MKKIKYLLLTMGSLFVTGLTSCDFLNKTPLDTIETNQYFINANAQALEQYCNYFYPRLIDGHGAPQSYSFGMMSKDFDADYLISWNASTIGFGQQTIPTTAGSSWNWANIRGCNDFLMNYEKSPEADYIKQRYAGEILFFKSMDYFNKVMTYGDVPWYDEPLEPGNEALYKPRDSRIVVMDNVLRDIDQAIAWLPKKTNVARISKDAAIALKARMCLFEGTFRKYHGIEGDVKFLEAAYEAAGELMKSEYGYSLFKGSKPSKAYYELFIQPDYKTNPEIILSKEYDPSVGMGSNLSRQIGLGETPIGLTRKAVQNYLCANTGLPISLCNCHDTNAHLIEDLKDRDPRLLQTVPTPEAGEFTYYLEGKRPAIGKIVAGNTGNSATGYCIVKFFNQEEFTSLHHQGSSDAPIFRFAEILLIRAEAGAELGKNPELDLTINALRERVGFVHKLTTSPIADPVLVIEYKNVTGNNASLIREIRRERSIELVGEGHRYYDLMRWAEGHNLAEIRKGIIPNLKTSPDDPTGYTAEEIAEIEAELGFDSNGAIDVYSKRVQRPAVFEDPKHYLQPIPLNEISLNPNLTQNPGWEL
jgi:hypothetical protein